VITGPRLHLWVLLLLIAVFVAVFGWWGNTRLRSTLEGTVRAELETTLNANVTALEIWVTNQTRLVSALASEPALRELALERLRAAPAERVSSRRSQPGWATEAPEGIDRYLQERLGPLGHLAVIVGTNLQVVAAPGRGRDRSTIPIAAEHQARFAEMFATGAPLMITPFRPRPPERMRPPSAEFRRRDPDRRPRYRGWTNRPAMDPDRMLMLVAAPLRDDTGVVRGGLARIIDPDKEFSRILTVARFGGSGETYAFDASGLMISRSRFEPQLKEIGLLENRPEVTSALTLPLVDPGGDLTRGYELREAITNRPLTSFMIDATSGVDGVDVKPGRDYRGVPVVAAWRWLPHHNFGVITQMDAREAYQALRILRMLFFVLFLLLVLSANGFFLASYLGVAWRRRLTEAELKARRLGQYQLEEKIGEGGMGVVYRARHALLRRDTAVKILLPDRADPEAIRYFEREVQLTCQLTHPNTIQVYDYGHTPEGLFYYAMEYLEGLNLKDLITHFGPQPEGRVIHVLGQVADALREAHDRGLVHRDIKPANVFLTDRGGVPDAVKVLDFGLVREYRSSADESKSSSDGTHALIGTPLFMSPESIRSPGRSDPRTDIYSLGALGYYLITGRPVFEGSTAEEVTEKHLHAKPPPPSHDSPVAISSSLEESLLRCLEKEPERRPGSVLELKALLLQSPHAKDWIDSDRAAWWNRHGPAVARVSEAAAPIGGSDHLPRILVDRTVRVQQG